MEAKANIGTKYFIWVFMDWAKLAGRAEGDAPGAGAGLGAESCREARENCNCRNWTTPVATAKIRLGLVRSMNPRKVVPKTGTGTKLYRRLKSMVGMIL